MFRARSLTRKGLSLSLIYLILLLGTNFLTSGHAHATPSHAKNTLDDIYTVCIPGGSTERAAFGNHASLFPRLAECGGVSGVFDWGVTTAGAAAGQAEWNDHSLGKFSNCRAEAYIPSDFAGAPGAQYFLFDGSHYLANFTLNQQGATGWTKLYNQSFPILNYMRVTLNNHDDTGAGGWDIAASAIRFDCVG